MKNAIIYSMGLSLAVFSFACSSSDNTDGGGTDATPTDTGGGGPKDTGGGGGPDGGGGMDVSTPDAGGGMPAAPTLGALIDRMGRAGVNTAVTDPFDTVNGVTEDMEKDMYNATTKDMWVTKYKAQFAGNIAIYDGLDMVCGNQFAAGPMPVAGRYDALAGVLADDQLYVDASRTTCTTYLAVEANATNIIPNMDCGGRTPTYNSIDVTYSVLVKGALMGVSSGVTMDDNTQPTTFPFIAAPN